MRVANAYGEDVRIRTLNGHVFKYVSNYEKIHCMMDISKEKDMNDCAVYPGGVLDVNTVDPCQYIGVDAIIVTALAATCANAIRERLNNRDIRIWVPIRESSKDKSSSDYDDEPSSVKYEGFIEF